VSISKKAVLEQSLAADLERVVADAAQLRQIVMNLVINASEAICDRSGTISLRSVMRTLSVAELGDAWQGVKPAAREYVSLVIADDGCGMSEETMRRVFEPFFTTKFTGRGLGMAAVLGIVKCHHGALKVESGEGRGTRFELLLPPLREGAPAESEDSAPTVAGLPPRRRILIVEDEADVRRVADSMCRKWGLLTDTAADGIRGVELFAADPDAFDLVLLDLTMPGLDGIEVAGRIRAIRPDVKILMVSGYDEAGRVDGHLPEEIDGFIQKPYRWSILKAKLADLLASSEGGFEG
jgi:two-component system cell cycle sensor histidine kinase/response regulator CckA